VDGFLCEARLQRRLVIGPPRAFEGLDHLPFQRTIASRSCSTRFAISSALYFATNPSGALVDGLGAKRTIERRLGRDLGRPHAPHQSGLECEFAIPFKSLGFPSGATAWGFNIARSIHRKLEENRWFGAVSTRRSSRCRRPARSRSSSISRKASASTSGPSRRTHAEARRRQRHRRETKSRYLLQHHAQPEADDDVQYRLR
jgi:hypothetical protein